MTTANTAAPQASVVISRTYRGSVEELWALWTTKAGFESWWGPEGFRAEVHAMEARAGGTLAYDMIADAPDTIAYMKQAGAPTSQGVRGSFGEFQPHTRLSLIQTIDFVPDSPVYDSVIEVAFSPAGDGQVSMVVTLHPHLDPAWTERAAAGFASQLTKLDRRFGWTGG